VPWDMKRSAVTTRRSARNHGAREVRRLSKLFTLSIL
jgi:hypothetical protein